MECILKERGNAAVVADAGNGDDADGDGPLVISEAPSSDPNYQVYSDQDVRLDLRYTFNYPLLLFSFKAKKKSVSIYSIYYFFSLGLSNGLPALLGLIIFYYILKDNSTLILLV